METWYEESARPNRSSFNTVGGYLHECCEAAARLRQQRKISSEINELTNRCQILQQKIDKTKQRLIVGP